MARLPRGQERRGEAATRRSGGDEKKQKDERVREADACDWSDHNERLRGFFYLCVS